MTWVNGIKKEEFSTYHQYDSKEEGYLSARRSYVQLHARGGRKVNFIPTHYARTKKPKTNDKKMKPKTTKKQEAKTVGDPTLDGKDTAWKEPMLKT